MSLSKLKPPKMKPISDRELEDENAVSYTSVNSKTHTSFTAVTDPNSRHAARLAKIALAVQQNDHKKRYEKKPKSSSWLPQIGFFQQQQQSQQPHRSQLEYQTSSAVSFAGTSPGPAYPEPGPQAYAYNQSQDPYQSALPRDRPSQTTLPPHQVPVYLSSSTDRSHSRSSSTAYEEVVDVVEVVDVAPPGERVEYHYDHDTTSGTYPTSTMTVTTVIPVHTRHPVGTVIPANSNDRDRDSDYYQPVEVTRYRTEHKTGYQLRGKTPGDVLRVSAPKWSSEAQLFDAIAEANSAKSATAEYDTGDSGTDPRHYQGKLVKRGRGRGQRF